MFGRVRLYTTQGEKERKGNKMSDRKQMIIKALKTAISGITAIGDDEYDDILDNGGKPTETIENMKIIIRTLSE